VVWGAESTVLEYEAVTIGKKLRKFRSDLLPLPSESTRSECLLGLTGALISNDALQLFWLTAWKGKMIMNYQFERM
jgi:hypothetical protein